MNLKFKIIEKHEAQHSIVVRFYTDVLTEDVLANQWDADGSILRCRYDFNIDLPTPVPADLAAFLKPIAERVRPQLAKEEAIAAGQTDMASVDAYMDVEHVADAPDFDVAAQQWEAIKSERDRRTLNGGYKVGDHWFHSDLLSRSQQIGLLLMGASMTAGLQWKTMSGEFVEMTPTLAQQVFQAAAAQDQATFTAAETHHQLLLASADPAAYDFSAGWPEVFGG